MNKPRLSTADGLAYARTVWLRAGDPRILGLLPMTDRGKNQVRLYQWINWERGRGAPFTMCDAHAANHNPTTIPAYESCSLDKLADQATGGCSFCEQGTPLDFSE